MSAGRALLPFLGSGFAHIFRGNRLYKSKDISNTMSLSVDVRRSETPLTKSAREKDEANPVI